MILFINGPFGVGKTSVARVLVERTPDAMLYDPEVIGSVLRRVLGPVRKVDDFQDYALWRKLVVAVARVLKAASAPALVIPMTIWRRDYFDSIAAGLRRVDPDLRCFRLTASEGELLRRHIVRLGGQGDLRVAHVSRGGLPRRITRPGFRGGGTDGRPYSRGSRGSDPRGSRNTDRIE